jgi:hypothetical protein
VTCSEAIPYPPAGQAREWWQRLKNAFGTASSAFVGASLQQLIAAARLPNSGISEIAGTPAWHSSRAQSLEGEAECALVIQMACMLALFEERYGRKSAVTSGAPPPSLPP